MRRVQCNPLEQQINVKLDKMFQKKNCFIQVQPGNITLPSKYAEIAEAILDLEIRKDDVWVVSYPRTGSTWAQEMVWLLGNNLDYDSARQIQIARTPLLELSAIFGEDHADWLKSSMGNSVDAVAKRASPRFIKSHLPLHLLPTQLQQVEPKIIYTSRNPKDLCVSYYYYCQLVHDLQSTFNEFCELFLSDNVPMGDVSLHMLAFWNMRHKPNILFLKYEEMKRNFPATIEKCAKFLNREPLTDDQMQTMCDYLKFDKMQKNPAVNLEPVIGSEDLPVKFIRKGQIGDWKNYMDEEMSARFDTWIEEKFRGSGLEFEYE
ncbi:luciferin sulfotransferase-like [Culicoides brevitarsis]|uniref:luciferin sulfotransferase-like n=1 Tax=Culicoides brevitarsis TaxID=469753 RepID=UPI00307B8466